jgi:hypothetical protein
MSLQDGMAAIRLEMPERVPRTEYSAHSHWDLVSAVTGIKVGPDSPVEDRQCASREFVKAWNYDFMWSTSIHHGIFGKWFTSMGHAVYASGGGDYRDDINCPFKTPEDVLKFDPWEAIGPVDRQSTVDFFEQCYRNNCEAWPNAVNMTGIYVTCISGLIDLFGFEMLLFAAGTDKEAFGALTDRYASWIQQYFDALGDADVPVVMVHDDIVWTSGPFLHPDFYRQHVFPNYKKYMAPLLDSGKRIIYTSDGDFTVFIDDIADTGVHGFCMEPTTDMKAIAEKYGKTHVFIGNADTRVLLAGSREDIRREVERCMDIGKDCPGFFMAVGNHIAPNTPVENAIYYNEVYQELSRR